MKIPLSAPDISIAEIEAVVEVLRGTQLSRGPQVVAFERAVAEYLGVPHAVAVNSGTSALHLCVRGLGIGEGDEVIVPSFTFVAAANAVRYERATPVFVDIEPGTLNIAPEKIEAAITAHTKAIMAVHTFGVPADMDAILNIGRRHGLMVIEDACEAIGAEYHGHKVGSLGNAAAFAFYPNKQITTGEGGVLVTREAELAKRARALRNHGRYEGDSRHQELGYNYRIADINCALGLAQIGRLEEILGRRAEVARKYDEALRSVPGLILPPRELPGERISWFVYVVRLAEGLTESDRDRVAASLQAAGIATGKYFMPIHRQPAYRDALVPHPLAVTEQVGARTLALPFFNRITDEEIREVCKCLRDALAKIDPA
jgi:dTDP-4-amino-4,6-dideoxygalactose transaminase